ncbi:hypothetical protein AAE478_002094 [Parahypoxylon ruwenzoriense]
MATPRLTRSPTCLDCLRRLAAQPAFTLSSSTSLSPLSLTQTRGVRMSRAEKEELQGIPVRLLKDVHGFGRKDTIVRVKPGRMRNYWFPKAQAEYMTVKRFKELGLTEAAISPRDRSFGARVANKVADSAKKSPTEEAPKKTKKDTLTLPPEETLSLLQTLLPEILTFFRKPIPAVPAPPPPPSTPAPPSPPRSPSLAANAAASTDVHRPSAPEPAAPAGPVSIPIFGSVSATDILAAVKEKLLAEGDAAQVSRIALEAEGVQILGLDEGEDRIKHLGTFDVRISASKDLEPVHLTVVVAAEE